MSDSGPPELHELTSTELSKFLDEDLESNGTNNAFCDLDSILDDLQVADTHLLLTNPEQLLNGNGGSDGLQLVAMSPNGSLSNGLQSPQSMVPSLLAPINSSPSNGNGTLISSTIDFGCDLAGVYSNASSNSNSNCRTSPISPFDDLNGITVVSSGDSSNECVSPTPSSTASTIIHHHHHHLNINSNQQQQHISILSTSNKNNSNNSINNSNQNQSKSLLRQQQQPQLVSLRNGPNSPSIPLRANPNLPHPQATTHQQKHIQHHQLQLRNNSSQQRRDLSVTNNNTNGTTSPNHQPSKASQLHALRAQTATPTPQPDSTTPSPSTCSTQQKPQSGSILQNALLAAQMYMGIPNNSNNNNTNQNQRSQQQSQQGSDQSLLSQQQKHSQQQSQQLQVPNGTLQQQQQQQQQHLHSHHRSLFTNNYVNNKNDLSMQGMWHFLIFFEYFNCAPIDSYMMTIGNTEMQIGLQLQIALFTSRLHICPNFKKHLVPNLTGLSNWIVCLFFNHLDCLFCLHFVVCLFVRLVIVDTFITTHCMSLLMPSLFTIRPNLLSQYVNQHSQL